MYWLWKNATSFVGSAGFVCELGRHAGGIPNTVAITSAAMSIVFPVITPLA
ncbi:MAG: hypothetical protein Kow0047_24830 [Anaerolineae bacterium]